MKSVSYTHLDVYKRQNKCFDKLKKQLKGNKIIGEIEYIEPLKNNKEENINKTINWIKNL